MNILDIQHNIRTPLAIMLGYGDMLSRDMLDEKQVKLAGREIYKAALQLDAVINDLIIELEKYNDNH